MTRTGLKLDQNWTKTRPKHYRILTKSELKHDKLKLNWIKTKTGMKQDLLNLDGHWTKSGLKT